MAIRNIARSPFKATALVFLLLAGSLRAGSKGQSSTNTGATTYDLVRQAQDAQRRGDYRSAREIYQKLLDLQPGVPEIQANLGLMYFLTGQYKDAEGQFTAALHQHPHLFVPNLFLGLTMLKFGKPRDALPYLLEARRLNPHDENVFLGLGRAYAEVGQGELAIASYLRAVEISPENAEALFGLGTTYLDLEKSAAERIAKLGKESYYGQMLLAESFLNQGRAADSIHIYKQISAANPPRPGLHTSTGFAYVNRLEVSAARSEFQADIDSYPNFLPAHLGMARVALEERNSRQCLSELESVWKTDPEFMKASISLLWLSAESGAEHMRKQRLQSFAETEPVIALREWLRDAISSKNPPSLSRPWPNYPVGDGPSGAGEVSLAVSSAGRNNPQTLFSMGEYTECAQTLGRSNLRLPPASLLLMAHCNYLSGKYANVLSISEKILNTDPGNVAALYWEAEAAEELALDALSRAGVADPKSYHTHLLMGQAYRAAQDYRASEIEYSAALEVKPSDYGARLGLATTYWKELKFDQALEELGVVLAAHPEDTQANYVLGEILVTRHQYTEARSHLLVAIGGEGDSALRAHALLSKVYAVQGDLHSAINELRMGLPADQDGSLHYQPSRLYEQIGDHQKAIAALQQSQALREHQAERARRGVETTH